MISIPTLDKSCFTCSFGNGKFSSFYDSKLVGSDSLLGNDNLYMLDAIIWFNESPQFNTRDIKRRLINENSAAL